MDTLHLTAEIDGSRLRIVAGLPPLTLWVTAHDRAGVTTLGSDWPRLDEKVEEWCNRMLPGRWRMSARECTLSVQDSSHGPIETTGPLALLTFEHETDLVAFRLRWDWCDDTIVRGGAAFV